MNPTSQCGNTGGGAWIHVLVELGKTVWLCAVRDADIEEGRGPYQTRIVRYWPRRKAIEQALKTNELEMHKAALDSLKQHLDELADLLMEDEGE